MNKTKTMDEIRDIELYEKIIRRYANEQKDEEFYNHGDQFASIVFRNIFNTSNSEVKILAGSLCNKNFPDNSYISALSDYVLRRGKLLILVQSYEEDEANNSDLFTRLRYYAKQGYSVTLKSTSHKYFITNDDSSKSEIHFTVAEGRMYRIETDIDKRSAICNFNDIKSAAYLNGLFDQVFNSDESSVEIDLTKTTTGLA